MPRWLQFVAEHRIILWLLLASGIYALLSSTVFYARMVAAVRRFADSQFVHDAALRNRMIKPLNSVCITMMGATWFRVWSIVQGVVFVGAGVTGLLLL